MISWGFKQRWYRGKLMEYLTEYYQPYGVFFHSGFMVISSGKYAFLWLDTLGFMGFMGILPTKCWIITWIQWK